MTAQLTVLCVCYSSSFRLPYSHAYREREREITLVPQYNKITHPDHHPTLGWCWRWSWHSQTAWECPYAASSWLYAATAQTHRGWCVCSHRCRSRQWRAWAASTCQQDLYTRLSAAPWRGRRSTCRKKGVKGGGNLRLCFWISLSLSLSHAFSLSLSLSLPFFLSFFLSLILPISSSFFLFLLPPGQAHREPRRPTRPCSGPFRADPAEWLCLRRCPEDVQQKINDRLREEKKDW